MKKIKLAILTLGLMIGFSTSPLSAITVFKPENCPAGSQLCNASEDKATDMIRTIINTLLFGIGVVAVIMIIHSGLKYIISRGDQSNIENAKNTLLYSVIGLVVAILAFPITNFVIGLFE